MKVAEFKQKIAEYLNGLDLKKSRKLTIDEDGGVWTIRTGMYEDLVEVRVDFVKDKKKMIAYVYETGDDLLIQAF
jgi:hypothetical protein